MEPGVTRLHKGNSLILQWLLVLWVQFLYHTEPPPIHVQPDMPLDQGSKERQQSLHFSFLPAYGNKPKVQSA